MEIKTRKGVDGMYMKEIEIISELINYHSFSDAALSLAYSTSAISKYVTNVEKELGIKIFIRGNKSNELTLTPEGRVLINEISKLNTDYQHMLELTKQLKGSFDYTLRVGSQARLGNQIEQEILASFLVDNLNADVEQVKMNSKDLLKLLQEGKLDAMFMSVHKNASLEEFFHESSASQDIDITFLASETEIYLGISDQYLPGVTHEAKFSDFKDFSFAFAFPMSRDENDSRAIESFISLARQSGFKLKTSYFGAHDATILKLATKIPIAVTSTHIPAQFEGIKFVRVSDWNSYTNVYFLCLGSNRKKILQNLKKNVRQYINQEESNV